MNKASAAQIRKIYVMARESRIDNDDLHSLLYSLCKKKHLSSINVAEAIKLIDCLSGKNIPGRVTDRQIYYIKSLSKEFGWNDKRLAGFIKKVGGADSIKWLTKRQASAVIEGMKKLKEKGAEVYG